MTTVNLPAKPSPIGPAALGTCDECLRPQSVEPVHWTTGPIGWLLAILLVFAIGVLVIVVDVMQGAQCP
jgi:hypothetical protein